MRLPPLLLLLCFAYVANGCDLCAVLPYPPATDCPSGSICDNTLVNKQPLPTGCIRYNCTNGIMLAKTTTDLQRQVDYLECTATKMWNDDQGRSGYSSITCVLSDEDRKCSYPPLPDPIPEGYKISSTAVYDKTTRVLKCTNPSSILVTQSKIGLGTTVDGCLHLESAICADIFKCSTTFSKYNGASVYASDLVINIQDFTASCPKGQSLEFSYDNGGFSTTQGSKLTCIDGRWGYIHKPNGVAYMVDDKNQAGCYTDNCPPLEASSNCGEGKICTPAELKYWKKYECPSGSKLVFVTNGQIKVGADLTCSTSDGKWKSGGVTVTECSTVRCEADKCPELTPIEQTSTFTKDYKGLPMVREDEERYSCPVVVYEDSLQKYVDYNYDVYVESSGVIKKAGKYLSCGQSGGKWGWKSDDGTNIELTDKVYCALKNCQFCVSQSLTDGCIGYDQPNHNKSLGNGDCSVSYYSCPANRVLRSTDQGPNVNYKSAPQPFTCQSGNWNSYKAPYGVGNAKNICCDKLENACSVKNNESCPTTFDCRLPTLDTTAWTYTCPVGYGFFDKTILIQEQTAKCNMNDYEWYTTAGNKKLVKTKQFFCKKI